MHPSFSQLVTYMVCKQEQCVSNIIDVATDKPLSNVRRYGIKSNSGVLVPKVTWSMGDIDLPIFVI